MSILPKIPKSRIHKKSLQTRYLEILEGHHADDRWSHFSQMFITALVLANIAAVVLETAPSIASCFGTALQ